MNGVFVDTAGLLCYHNDDDSQHATAQSIIDGPARKYIHSYVLAEFTALAETRKLPREAALGFALKLLDISDLYITWVDEDLHREALALLQNRLDKTYSLCDGVSFVIMRQIGITDALTTDRHFVQEGFVKLLD